MRGFLLQNLRFGDSPSWRIGLDGDRRRPAADRVLGRRAGAYAGPTLVLRGERSDYILPEHRPLFRALFPAARFLTLKDAGHWLHADNPEAFLATAQAFFAPLRSPA